MQKLPNVFFYLLIFVAIILLVLKISTGGLFNEQTEYKESRTGMLLSEELFPWTAGRQIKIVF